MSNYYYGILMAVMMLLFYFVKDQHDILYLFAATWFVIHAVGEKVVTALKKPEVEKEITVDDKP
jgi:hypothetical protein